MMSFWWIAFAKRKFSTFSNIESWFFNEEPVWEFSLFARKKFASFSHYIRPLPSDEIVKWLSSMTAGESLI